MEDKKNLIIETDSFRFELKKNTPFTRLMLETITDWLRYRIKEEKELAEKEIKPAEKKEPVEPDIFEKEINKAFEQVNKSKKTVVADILHNLNIGLFIDIEYRTIDFSYESLFKLILFKKLKGIRFQTGLVKYLETHKEEQKKLGFERTPDQTTISYYINNKLDDKTKKIIELIVEKIKEKSVKSKILLDIQPLKKERAKRKPAEKEKPVEPKKPEITEKPPKVEIVEEPTPVWRKSQLLFDRKHLLKQYDTVMVWDLILDFILDNVGAEFTIKDVTKYVSKYYKEKLKRKIRPSSEKVYASCYVRYMREEMPDFIEHCDDPYIAPVIVYRKTKPRKKKEKKLKSYGTWTKEEDEIIIEWYPTMTASAIKLEKLPHRSEQAIYDRAGYLNIQKIKWKEEPEIKTKARLKVVEKVVEKPEPKVEKKEEEPVEPEKPEVTEKPPKIEIVEEPPKEIPPEPSKEEEKPVEPEMPEIPEKPEITEITVKPPKVEIVEEPLKEVPPEPPEIKRKPVKLSDIAKDIYSLAEDRWKHTGEHISIERIEKLLNDRFAKTHSFDEIGSGLAQLIEDGKATQIGITKIGETQGKIKFH